MEKETECYYVIECPCRLRLGAPSWGMYFHNTIFLFMYGDIFDVICCCFFLFLLSLSESNLTSDVILVSMADRGEFCIDVQERPSFLTRQKGFLGTPSGLSGPLLPTSAFQATALVAPPPGGLEHGVTNTMPDMNSTINGAEQDWFHLPYRVVG